MHYIKLHIKTLKIAPTCFDPKIILRELLTMPDAFPTTYSYTTRHAATTPC